MKQKILVVDDEPDAVELLEVNLEGAGYTVASAHDGEEALKKARMTLPDLIILDLMLPEVDGMEVCKILRRDQKTSHIPIIMLTAKAAEIDRVLGLELGADDYVTKPFSVKVLLQRIKAIQRRFQGEEEPADIIDHLGVRVDRVRHQVSVNAKALELTPTEFRLLECFLRQPGRAFTRAQLMDAAMGEEAVVLERTIDVHVKSLRRKLGPAGKLIETVRGLGYRFRENEA